MGRHQWTLKLWAARWITCTHTRVRNLNNKKITETETEMLRSRLFLLPPLKRVAFKTHSHSRAERGRLNILTSRWNWRTSKETRYLRAAILPMCVFVRSVRAWENLIFADVRVPNSLALVSHLVVCVSLLLFRFSYLSSIVQVSWTKICSRSPRASSNNMSEFCFYSQLFPLLKKFFQTWILFWHSWTKVICQ